MQRTILKEPNSRHQRTTIALSAFDFVSNSLSRLRRYLHDKPVNFISVSTARATLDAAHQYLCPGLARLAVSYLEAHLTPSTVLEIYQGLGLYANDPREDFEEPGFDRSPDSPSAPPPLEDDVGVIGAPFVPSGTVSSL